MNYPWPMNEVASHIDEELVFASVDAARSRLAALGLHRDLVELLAPLYARADAVTLFDGSLRLHPLAGYADHGLPDLAAWNAPDLWKRYEPQKINGTFYFCSNSFGDQLGIPVDEQGGILHDRVGVLWVERFEYQEAKVPWHTFFSRLAGEESMREFFLRSPERTWAAATLGTPSPWQCFSSNVPAVIGGTNTIDNVSIESMLVHVSFTLQIIRQALQHPPGTQLPMADVQDSKGNSLP